MRKGQKMTPEQRKRVSDGQRGRKHSEETKRKMSLAGKGNKRWLGKKHSPQTKKKMSLAAKGNKNNLGKKRGPLSLAKKIKISLGLTKEKEFKGFRRKEYQRERGSSRYKKWRASIVERDEYTCQHCGSKKELEVHHIKNFYHHRDKAYDIDNGLTLCKKCHIKVDKYRGRYEKNI